MSAPAHFFDLTPETLTAALAAADMPAFRARQVMQWVYEHGIIDPQRMTNLAKTDRAKLAAHLRFTRGQVVEHQIASDGTQKLLLAWHPLRSEPAHAGSAGSEGGGERALRVVDAGQAALPQTECVMIPSRKGRQRYTACISSQVGCPVGCNFCASGLGGLEANLTAGQIVEQIWHLSRLPNVERITNIVFMGMGEPLANFEQVTRALGAFTADWAFNLSARRITISTVGLPAQIRRLAAIELPITLALSLHAPNDEVRRKLIPWAQRVSVDQLIEACRFYFDKTGREVTLEYTLLHGVNDLPEHAYQLVAIARKLRSNVNLIRYNEVAGLPHRRPHRENVLVFQQILQDKGINTHIRASRGRDIAAACGQLRYEHRPTATNLQ